MNLSEYQEKALRTESIVDEVVANKTELNYVLGAFVVVSEMLDCLKKKIYYKNPKKYNENFHELADRLHFMTSACDRHHDIPENEILTIDPRVFHGVIGAATETGELVEALQNAINGNPIDVPNFHEEMHDVSWYFAILHHALGLSWEQGLENNINKLRIRYPEKYSDDLAEHRNLEAERQALEVK
jgi:hypothetical protein